MILIQILVFLDTVNLNKAKVKPLILNSKRVKFWMIVKFNELNLILSN